MSGRQLKEMLWALEISPAKFCGEAKISIPTLHKIFNQKPVSEKTLFKVERAIQKLKGGSNEAA